MPFCIKCGNKLDDNARFCGVCGNPVKPVVTAPAAPSFMDSGWESIIGYEKVFTLLGNTIVIPANLDAFNSYRLRIRAIAIQCTDKTANEYRMYINNLESFMRHFLNIYNLNLSILTHKAIDILVSENVWNISHEIGRASCRERV